MAPITVRRWQLHSRLCLDYRLLLRGVGDVTGDVVNLGPFTLDVWIAKRTREQFNELLQQQAGCLS